MSQNPAIAIFASISHLVLSHAVTGMPITLAVAVMSFTGCQSFQQQQAAQQSAKCGALCAKAREARQKGNGEQANEFINEALRQRPSDLETRRQLAETMWNSDRRSEAVAEVAALCALQPNDIRLATRLATMQWDTNQHRAAANTARLVLSHDPQMAAAWQIKARNEVEQGDLDDALVSYIHLSQLAPDDLTTLLELGELHLRRGNADRACPLLRSAVSHPQASSSQRAEIQWLLGVAYARTERWTLAVTVLEPAIALRKASAEDWCFLGWIRMQCGDFDAAQSDLQRALECDPQSIAAQSLSYQLTRAVESQSNPNRATPIAHRDSILP